MSSSTSRKETERTKLVQAKCQTLLTQMLRDEDNKYCVDCDAKGPRWASWNLGVFLCIRCAGIHRNLGVHISRVKSVNLDTWTPEQVISLQQMGNSRARAVYEAQMPDGFRRPQTDTALESFIRAKYEHKKYIAREWVPPSPPKVDWAKEIDEELERQKRKKKTAQANNALGIGIMSGSTGSSNSSEKKTTSIGTAKSSALPAPLPKPKPGQSGSSPKNQRVSTSSAGGDSNQSNDLLGLSSPTKPTQPIGNAQDLHNESFSSFLSATPTVDSGNVKVETNANPHSATENSLAKEEEDFFNQGSLSSTASEKDKSGKLTKDSILALYATAPTNNPPFSFGQPQPMFGGTGGFTGMAPGGYMPTGGAAPHTQHAQFMTPPNSTSMYNAPVMAAPVAFTASGMGMPMGGAVSSTGFGAQFPMQSMGGGVGTAGFAQPMAGMGMMPSVVGGGATSTGIMATGQPSSANINMNLMHTNQSLLSGMSMAGIGVNAGVPSMAPQQPIGNMGMPIAGNATNMGSISTGNLNQQFSNLNIGNVWQ